MGIQSGSGSKTLRFKDNISSEVTAVNRAGNDMPHTTYSLPIYDEHGNLLGYVALFATATFTGGTT